MKRISYLDMVRTVLPADEFEEFAKVYDKPIKKSIKLMNRTREATKQRLESEWWILTPPDFEINWKKYDDVLRVDKPWKESLWSHSLHQDGSFYVQEMAAGMPAQVLMENKVERWVFLDLCAAPWGKAIQLADFAWDDGIVIANEIDPRRRKALIANLERCWIMNAIVTGYDWKKLAEILAGKCDKVLVDAPCSGEGMQYKKDFKVYSWNEKKIRNLAKLQVQLFISGFKCLKKWWEIVYSTCTTNKIENEWVVEEVLKEFWGEIELLSMNRLRPHIHHTGWFFMTKFRKIWKVQQPELWCDKCMEYLQTKYTVWATTKQVKEFLDGNDGLFIERAGLPAYKVLADGKRKKLTHLKD